MSIREMLEEMDSFMFADGLDEALIGFVSIAGKDVALYDREKAIQIILQGDMDYEEAEEFFDYNVLGAYVGEKTAFATLLKE